MILKQASAYLLVSHGSRDPRPQAAIAALVQLMIAQLQKLHLHENPIQHTENRYTENSEFSAAFAVNKLQDGLPENRAITTEELAQPQITLEPFISTAVLELHPLPLHEQIYCFAEQAIARNYNVIQILPLFLLAGMHVTEDIPTEMAIAQKKLGDRIVLEQSPHVGSHLSVQSLIVNAFEVPAGAAQILLSHGSRRSQGNVVIEAIAQRIGAQAAYWSVSPSLESQVNALIKQGCREIAVLPYFLFAGGITDAIAQTVANLALQHPDVRLHLAQPLGANPTFANQLVDLIEY